MKSYHMQPGTLRFMVLASNEDRQKVLRRGWVKVYRDSLPSILPASFFRILTTEAKPGEIWAYSKGEIRFGQTPGKDDKFYFTGESLKYLPTVSKERRASGSARLASVAAFRSR